MKLLQITLAGFLSFRDETTIKIKDGVTYVLGSNQDQGVLASSNGSGKTTLIAAIAWALYGSLPSGAGKDAVVNRDVDQARVELVGDDLHIIRVKPRGKSEILKWKGDGPWKTGDFPVVHAELLEYIGVDRDTFFNTVFLSRYSKSVQFLRAQPSERARMVSEVVDDQLFQTAARLIQADMEKIAEETKGDDIVLRELDYAEDKLRTEKTQLEMELRQLSKGNTERKEAITRDITLIKAKIRKEMEAFVNVTTYNLEELYTKKATTRKRLDLMMQEVAGIRKSLKQLKAFEPGDVCPTCQRELTEEECLLLGDARDKLIEESTAYDKSLEILEGNLEKLELWITQTQEHKQRKETALVRIRGYKREAALLIDSLKADQNTAILEGMLKENSQSILELDERRLHIMTNRDDKTRKIPLLKELKKSFQQDLRNILLDRIRNGLKYYTKKYLSRLLNKVDVEYPPQNKTGAEKFEIVVRHNGSPQELSTYSGGESWRVTFAILMGLRRILLDGKKQPFEFLLVDDPVGELDEPGCKHFFDLLQCLKEEIPQILVTVPRDLEAPGRELHVVKKGGVSSLVSSRT
jgi:DNA repair exonuclease SbcCD ATPase subunit